ncbi:MAG TPA: sigma-70 family RNA polymerase sigma factor [Baekduia sp.]|nr:sigma-70 family RNA polymerase sigma factor [Baekduia sp.]
MDVDRLYHRHAQRLYGFLAYRTGDRLLAEDLVGDVFERALRSRRRFDPRRGTEEAWLYAIAVNLLRDHARRASAERRALERLGPPAAATAPRDDAVARHDELLSALRSLSDEERETVALRFGADLTIAQIARATGEPGTTIDGRLRRGLRRLRERLDDAGTDRASAVG